MNNQDFRPLLVWLAIGIGMLGIHFIGVSLALDIKIHFLIFLLHSISLVTTWIVSRTRSGIAGFVFLGLMLLKMGGMVWILFKIPSFKDNVLGYFSIYWFYLFVETWLVSNILQNSKVKKDINQEK